MFLHMFSFHSVVTFPRCIALMPSDILQAAVTNEAWTGSHAMLAS